MQDVNEEMEKHWDMAMDDLRLSAREAPPSVPKLRLEELPEFGKVPEPDRSPELGDNRDDDGNKKEQ